jgi:HAD superfamily hydrolase (TIGR01490 family)
LLRRRDRTKARLAQLVFVRYGAGTSRVGRTAESGMAFLKGLPVETMREIVAEAVDTAFRPHVYRDALDLVAQHRERGERSFVVSAALQEIVDALVAELVFDGGVGSTAEVEDGVYTGRLVRRLDGSAKAEVLGDLAATEGIDLSESTAYSDSASDVPFLAAVGHPVAVNPDRRLRAIAAERGWRVLRFSAKAFPA